jgi:hypothetical protein
MWAANGSTAGGVWAFHNNYPVSLRVCARATNALGYQWIHRDTLQGSSRIVTGEIPAQLSSLLLVADLLGR